MSTSKKLGTDLPNNSGSSRLTQPPAQNCCRLTRTKNKSAGPTTRHLAGSCHGHRLQWVDVPPRPKNKIFWGLVRHCSNHGTHCTGQSVLSMFGACQANQKSELMNSSPRT